ncbi:MAG TPA: hypothetical protein ENG48_03240, partial [Candidatus Atribacteria bacterium]|nr:hypothetical protein [Candidatus Atribacteria bacterium]
MSDRLLDKYDVDLQMDEMIATEVSLSDNVNRTLKGKDELKNINVQAYTLVDHLGTYGLEGYGETPTPNDYGLVSNNGQVYTVRDDDLPFDEARHSFAVEEGTTNYCSDNDPKIGDTQDSVYISAVGYYGTPFEATGDYYKDIAHFYYDSALNANTAVTFQVELKVYGGTSSVSFNLYGSGLASSGAKYTASNIAKRINLTNGVVTTGSSAWNMSNDNNWYRFIVTFDLPEDISAGAWRFEVTSEASYETGKYLLHRNAQMEIKSFATSFVDGTRAPGIIQIPKNFDTNSDWVIAFTIKALNTSNSQIFLSIDKGTHLNGFVHNGFYTMTLLDNENIAQHINTGINFNGTTHDFIVWIKKENVYYVYVNGVKVIDYTMAKPLQVTYDSIILGNYYENLGAYASNSLISNLFIGTYDSSVWTDEFIQELYDKQVIAKSLAQINKSPTPPKA